MQCQAWVWRLAKVAKRPAMLRCNKCRGGWGLCELASLATIRADIADCMSGVRDLQNLLAEEAIDLHFITTTQKKQIRSS